MNRQIVYPGAIPLETDLLNAARFGMNGLGWMAQSTLGTATAVDGLSCIPTSPASMTVQVTAGAIYAQAVVDGTAFGSLPSDTTHQIVKQGLLADTQSFTLVAPITSGFAQNILIQAAFSEVDGGSTVLPYYNASDPSTAYSGPSNSGVAQNTVRQGLCVVSSKAGAAAISGSQTTPSPDPGFVGLYVITLAYGQTTITSGNIAQLATAPFIPAKLPQIPAGIQNGSWLYAADTGSANVLAITLAPSPIAYVAGMGIRVKVGNTNTGPATLNINGLGAVSITNKDGSTLTSGTIIAGQMIFVIYDGANFQLQASAGTSTFSIPYALDTSGAANTITATFSPAITTLTAGLLIQVKVANTNTTTTTINVNGLGAKTIKTSAGANLSSGAITAGQIVLLTYDGTNFQLGSIIAGSGTSIPYVADSGGSANTVVANFSPAVASYAAGLLVEVLIANTNTGASTLNCNSLGATTIVRNDGSALQPGDLVAGKVAVFVYNGTNFQFAGTSTVQASIGGGFRKLVVQTTSNTAITITADALTVEDSSGNARRLSSVNVSASITSSGANGLDTGTEANSTWYYGFVIWNPVAGTVAALLSASATSPTLPAGYTYWARVSAHRNDSSGNFWRSIQYERIAQLQIGTNPTSQPIILSGGNTTTPTAISIVPAFSPPTASHVFVTPNPSGGDPMGIGSNASMVSGSRTNPPFYGYRNSAGSYWSAPRVEVMLESSSIYYISDSDPCDMFANGWKDNL